MLFFILMVTITAAAALLGRLGVPGLTRWPARLRWGMAVPVVLAGIDHLATPARYVAMIESFLPQPAAVVLLTGLCEIAGGVGLLLPRTRRLAGVMLALYFVCVFPANINVAINGLRVEGMPAATWYYWLRLAFQPVIVAWALWAVEVLPRQGLTPAAGRHTLTP